MELDLQTKQQLADLIAQPASVSQAHANMLSNLIERYPYYQPLHLLLAKANSEQANTLANAALYTNGSLLHQVIHQPHQLKKTQVKIVSSSFAIKADDKQIIENDVTTAINTADEQETFNEIEEVEVSMQQQQISDDQEVFDEIVEINTSEFAPSLADEPINLQPVAVVEEQPKASIPDAVALENIVATDFFEFEKSFSAEQVVVDEPKVNNIPVVEEYNQEAEEQTVSKYNDDKLPYTFLWWLAKTRKEHEQIFQPYVTPKKSAPVANQSELQHQYVEHIFHIQAPFNMSEEASLNITNPLASRGNNIIDSFIKNEPQIGPPKAEQINNENKAKKSAEDHNDLVSETLASIYIEQMLYHKAIDTYEKLSLKFPEKSRYFADLIQSLEKKI
ncbi:MAG: hypothetical protein EOO42_13295 [Flavobacteriales bacterium]|nr:MAG: hypothetical protein EOO42_13295 [Flavobacteriales bacterium]